MFVRTVKSALNPYHQRLYSQTGERVCQQMEDIDKEIEAELKRTCMKLNDLKVKKEIIWTNI
jgi:hypothetical protein